MAFYDDMRATADSLLGDLGQGTIGYLATEVVAPGLTDIDPPTITRTYALVNGVARGVSSKFVDNETILASDLQVIVQARAEVAVGDALRIDGVDHAIVRVDNIPAAGTVVARRVIVRR